MKQAISNLWMILGSFGAGLLILYLKLNLHIFLSLSISFFIVAVLYIIYPFDINSVIFLWIFLVITIETIRYIFFVADKEEPYIPRYQQINHHGRVIVDIKRGKKGKVLLDAPLLGDEIWPAMSDEYIKAGERVVIEEIRGQILFVAKES